MAGGVGRVWWSHRRWHELINPPQMAPPHAPPGLAWPCVGDNGPGFPEPAGSWPHSSLPTHQAKDTVVLFPTWWVQRVLAQVGPLGWFRRECSGCPGKSRQRVGEGVLKQCFHTGVADPPKGSGLGLGLPPISTGWMALPQAGVMAFPRQPGGPWGPLSAPAIEGRHTPLPAGSHYPQAGQLAGYL